MPYIQEDERELLATGALPHTPGHLNYLLSIEVDNYLNHKGVSYTSLNDVMGVLACIQAEVYRRIATPYELKKLVENGEVFTCLEH